MKFRFAFLPTTAALLLIALMVALGSWQIQRGHTREAAHQQRIAIQDKPAIPLSDLRLDADTDALEGRPVTVRGQFVSDASVLLENRPQISGQDTRSGFILMSPFQLDIGGQLSQTIIWVARGWLPRDQSHFMSVNGLQSPNGTQTLQGHLVKEVSRVMQMGQEGGTIIQDGSTAERFEVRQNLNIKQFSKQPTWQVYPMALQESAAGQNDKLERNWALPGAGADRNYGYALQWFGFATIVAVLGLILAWRAAHPKPENIEP